MYENRQGQRLTLYVRSGEAGGDTAFRFSGDGGAATFYWIDGGFGYALAGEAGREALLPVARSVYESLTRQLVIAGHIAAAARCRAARSDRPGRT